MSGKIDVYVTSVRTEHGVANFFIFKAAFPDMYPKPIWFAGVEDSIFAVHTVKRGILQKVKVYVGSDIKFKYKEKQDKQGFEQIVNDYYWGR